MIDHAARLRNLNDALLAGGNDCSDVLLDAARDLERLQKMAEVRYHEREQARARLDNAVRLLTGIHSLLYPPRFTDNDGRTWEFKYPGDPHAMLQELSDRIRALPDELARVDDAGRARNFWGK